MLLQLLADGVPIDCGGMGDALTGCYGRLPAVGIAAAAVLAGAGVLGPVLLAVLLPQLLNTIAGVPTGDGTPDDPREGASPTGEPADARIVSASLANADVFRAARSAGTEPDEPAVLVLRYRPDFDRRDFDRKARDLVRLGREGRLKKAAPDRESNKVYDPSTGKRRTRTNVYRERIIRRLTKGGRLTRDTGTAETNKYLANKRVVERLYAGKGRPKAAGVGYDPDHIQELQLDGKDTYDNFRLMDTWTNREIGREISVALRNVPEGTPVIVKVIP
ncbi:hypothetical protein GA0070606_2616 [Micromonospora citrea]|uniref:Uncharacterized protein n=1 Tax=Micromonospora citrea TaxID=47855 RepID=A0A1C6UR62_9ACTN|nr:hypothetical protein [Micromonospora citrea]SCL56488.1 hypothetical protein GA0070606_2616 [Micromonospora citrea]